MIKQFIPDDYCLKCDVCCRFPMADSPLLPAVLSCERNIYPCEKIKPISYKDTYICPFFCVDSNKCNIYEHRPLDCRLYPFILMRDSDNSVVLGVDPKCPYANANLNTNAFEAHKEYLLDFFNSCDISEMVLSNQQIIGPFQEDIIIIKPVARINLGNKLDTSGLKKLDITQIKEFENYAARHTHDLSAYCFAANYGWSDLINFYYKIIGNNFCLFAEQSNIVFMNIPPLGPGINKDAISECFSIMNSLNTAPGASRIENVEEKDLKTYLDMGLAAGKKYSEYICAQKDLAGLPGLGLRHKRNLCNYFAQNNNFKFSPYKPDHMRECIELFAEWAAGRKAAYPDSYYNALLDDSRSFHERLMKDFDRLGIIGYVVFVHNKIRGYTFGCEINKEMFCVLLETTDLKIKGLSQFISREFAKKLANYKYINIMDDSGLANLKKVKLSYRPLKLLPSFSVRA